MKELMEDGVYWIRHNELKKYLEGEVSKAIPDKTVVSLVRVCEFDRKKNAYFCYPIGRDVLFGIAVKDIKDAVRVMNPFKEQEEIFI